jgi:hypothetical protein
MNQRILEIADKAQKQAYAVYMKRMETEFPGDVIFHDIYNSLFAEMIVWECAEQSMSIGRYNTPSGVTPDLSIAIAVGLKKHFGVTE